MKVLVCGGRDFADTESVYDVLSKFDPETTVVITGAARGADNIALSVARQLGLWAWPCPADWARYGKAAGHRRNQRMLDQGKPDLVVAFPGGAGTANMIERAKKAGIEVREIARKA